MTDGFQTLDPTTGQLIQSFAYADAATIEQTLNQAHHAFLQWKTWTFDQRAEVLRTIADDLETNANKYARVMTLEMGKPISQGEAEIRKCALTCRYYAEHAARFLTDDLRKTEAARSYVRKEPLGIILAVMPWNFPFWQLIRVAAPSLMAGNVLVLKHASNVPQCALQLHDLFVHSDAPAGVLQSLFAAHQDIERIIANKHVKAVTLTGSNQAGIEVAQIAARHVKPCVLELGGSDPFIVFADADIDTAISIAVKARCLNNGQSCIAAKRFLVHQSIAATFTQGLVKGMQAQKMGNPIDKSVEIGPLANEQQRTLLHEQVLDAQSLGANILCGGVMPAEAGFFYPPTVLTNINPSMRVFHEEVFGPVATVIEFDTDDDALSIANSSVYGLGASIWTHDHNRIAYFSRELECGSVFINDFVRSDPRLPFGGAKESGYGRELGHEGIMSFVNVKTIWES